MKKSILSLIITFILSFIIYFFLLPPINITSMSFWVYIIMILSIYLILSSTSKMDLKGKIIGKINDIKILIISIFGITIGIMLINFILSPLFNSKAFSKRINVVEDSEDTNFITEVSEVDFNALPLLDKDSSSRLGDRVMGQMPELVSQFYVSSLYTQINYNNEIIRPQFKYIYLTMPWLSCSTQDL